MVSSNFGGGARRRYVEGYAAVTVFGHGQTVQKWALAGYAAGVQNWSRMGCAGIVVLWHGQTVRGRASAYPWGVRRRYVGGYAVVTVFGHGQAFQNWALAGCPLHVQNWSPLQFPTASRLLSSSFLCFCCFPFHENVSRGRRRPVPEAAAAPPCTPSGPFWTLLTCPLWSVSSAREGAPASVPREASSSLLPSVRRSGTWNGCSPGTTGGPQSAHRWCCWPRAW